MDTQTILISGPKRSGTHLLYRLLDSHPELFNALVEAYYLEYIDKNRNHQVDELLRYFVESEVEPLLGQIRERDLFPMFEEKKETSRGQQFSISFDRKEFRKEFSKARKSVEQSVESVWNAWFNSLQSVMSPKQAIRPVVFKCAMYGASARVASEQLSDTTHLFIVRNPVFALSSLRKMRENQQNRREFTTLRLNTELTKHRRFHETRRQLSDSTQNIYTIRFEDLVTQPEATMKDVAEFLNIPYQNVLAEPTFAGNSWGGDSSYERHDGISQAPLNPNRINLTDEEREIIGRSLDSVMEEFNYDLYPDLSS